MPGCRLTFVSPSAAAYTGWIKLPKVANLSPDRPPAGDAPAVSEAESGAAGGCDGDGDGSTLNHRKWRRLQGRDDGQTRTGRPRGSSGGLPDRSPPWLQWLQWGLPGRSPP